MTGIGTWGAPGLRDDVLSDDEFRLLGKLAAKTLRFVGRNKRLWDYYEGKAPLKNIGIAIPEPMIGIEAVLGWPEIVVDALVERIDWVGWNSTVEDMSVLDMVFSENQLDAEVSKAILDSMVTGIGFLLVCPVVHADNSRSVRVTAASSSNATVMWDEGENRVISGYCYAVDEEGDRVEWLCTQDSIIKIFNEDGAVKAQRFLHGLGRCALVALPNRGRSGAIYGRSEISPAIRYYTDHGMRTILEMEYNREIYTTPQRYLVNVLPEELGLSEDPSKSEIIQAGWQVAQNKALIVPPAEEGDSREIKVGEFSAAPPNPYIDELKMLTQLISAQSGVPATYLGFVTENPASADAIRVSESRLIRKAELRQAAFSKVLRQDLAFLCQAFVGGDISPEFIGGLSVEWRNTATPTFAATTDAMVKLAQVGAIDPSNPVVLARLGFSRPEIRLLEQQAVRRRAEQRILGLEQQAAAVSSEVQAQAGVLDDFNPDEIDADQSM